MKVKKTISIPVMIGIVSGSLIALASTAHFLIPVGGDTSIGIGEVFTLLSTALGGPIAVIITLLVTYGGVILLNIDLYTDLPPISIALADATAHLCALLVVAIGYRKLLYPQARKTSIFLISWWLTVGVYYYLVLLPLSVILLNLANPGHGVTYPMIARSLFPEYLGTTAITTMIWLALPAHYRRPQWITLKQMPDQSGRIQGE
jgi:hypothetical protein